MTDLPAPDAPQCYVVVGPDDQRGPYTLELLVSEVVADRLNENTPVWWPGLEDWTTMAAHPGVAAEIARRRGVAQPAPMAFAPPTAPPPPQQQPGTAPVDTDPSGPPVAATSTSEEPGGQPTHQQTFGIGADAGDDGTTPAAQDPRDGTAEGQQENDPGAIEVPAVEITPADLAAADTAAEDSTGEDGFRAAGVGEGLDPVHSDAFAEVVRRSRARADAASIIGNVNEALLTAMDEAAGAQGFSSTARGMADGQHELSYVRTDSAVLTVRMGRVRGRDLAGPEGEVPLNASVSSENHSGRLETGTGRHGEVVVRAGEHTSAHTASVELILGLSDYVDSGYEVDRDALQRDLQSVVATLSHRLSV